MWHHATGDATGEVMGTITEGGGGCGQQRQGVRPPPPSVLVPITPAAAASHVLMTGRYTPHCNGIAPDALM